MSLRTAALMVLSLGAGLVLGSLGTSSRPASASPEVPAAMPPTASPSLAPVRPRLTARDIAEQALGYTASIEGRVRGKDVYGAGVVIDRQGHVLTCLHVIEGLDPIRLTFSDGQRSTAAVVGRDLGLDLALLKLDTPRAVAAPLGSAQHAAAGDDVFTMGTPRRMPFSLSRGLLAHGGRAFDGVLYLQTDLPMNGGSSGGPVLNEYGELIGVASFVVRDSQGLAFALPVDYALRRFADALALTRDQSGFERWLSDHRALASDTRPTPIQRR